MENNGIFERYIFHSPEFVLLLIGCIIIMIIWFISECLYSFAKSDLGMEKSLVHKMTKYTSTVLECSWFFFSQT